MELNQFIPRSKYRVRFDMRHLKQAEGFIGRNVVNMTIKVKRIVRILYAIKIIKLNIRNLNKYLNFIHLFDKENMQISIYHKKSFSLSSYSGYFLESTVIYIYSHPQTDLFRSIRTH